MPSTDPLDTPGWLAATLSRAWADRWAECRPIGHELRHWVPDRWVRFHSLPGSKRYAETEAEYGEILARHHAVLHELAGWTRPAQPGDELIAVTESWSDSPAVVDRRPALVVAAPGAEPWTSVLYEEYDDEETWTHLFVSRVSLGSTRLDRLLRLVADDKTGDVILSDLELNWLYHPYDGGADVIAATTGHRDALAVLHADWLSAHPLGL